MKASFFVEKKRIPKLKKHQKNIYFFEENENQKRALEKLGVLSEKETKVKEVIFLRSSKNISFLRLLV